MQMLELKRWLLLGLCVVAAAICYFSGLASGAIGFIIAGALFETFFWFTLCRKKTS